MTHILHIDSSARTQGSVSRELTKDVVAQLGGTSTYRDLAQGLPQIDEAWLNANWSDATERSQAQSEQLALQMR